MLDSPATGSDRPDSQGSTSRFPRLSDVGSGTEPYDATITAEFVNKNDSPAQVLALSRQVKLPAENITVALQRSPPPSFDCDLVSGFRASGIRATTT
jgi:hypothetical protein